MIKTHGQLYFRYSSTSIQCLSKLNAIYESELESVSVLLEHSIRISNDLGLIEYTCNITDSNRNNRRSDIWCYSHTIALATYRLTFV